MKLLELLSWGDNKLVLRLAGAGVLSGVGGAALLGIVNTAAEEIRDTGLDQVNWGLASIFILISVAYFFAEVFLLSASARQVEQGIDKVRKKLFSQIAVADFAQLEAFGQARLYENITQSTQVISQNSHIFGMCFRSLLLLVAVMAYVFWLSALAFILIVVVIGTGIVIYLRMGKTSAAWMHKLHAAQAVMFDKVADLFGGIREVRMWSKRSDALFAVFQRVSEQKAGYGQEVHNLISRQMIMGMSAFYILLAVIVFVVPSYSDSFGSDVAKISTAVLFMMGPISVIVQSMSVFGMMEYSASQMISLSEDLEKIREPVEEAASKSLPDSFGEIAFEEVTFTYPNRDPSHGFMLGPITMTVRPKELLFVTGGNGAGKSTLIKLLTGLYRPVSGQIRIDQTALGPHSIAPYRNLISTVFSDFHLFSDVHGVEDFDPEEAAYWLERFDVSHVTAIDDGRFVNTNLSSGQRKRLGLIVAILENRPIIVLDEWAADQDPHFRKKFYEEILPDLKQRGRTIIAVTHDDHYFAVADRRLHLDMGKLVEVPLDDPRGRI